MERTWTWASNSTADGANLIWPSTGANNQHFTFTAISDGYYRITPVHSGKAVDVSGNSTADGANIQQWAYHGGNNQQWGLTPVNSSARASGSEKLLTYEQAKQLTGDCVHPNPAVNEISITLPDSYEEGAKNC